MEGNINNKKRQRSSNFSKTETRLLADLVAKYKNIIENKKTDAVTNRDKEAAWEKIAASFNATSGSLERSAKTLKLKYESIKKITKKKLSCHRQELYRTGGGPSMPPPQFDEEEEKVIAICSNLSGLQARYDSDYIEEKCSSTPPDILEKISSTPLEVYADIEIVNDKDSIDDQQSGLVFPGILEVEGTEITSNEIASLDHNKENVDSEDINNKWATWNPTALKTKKNNLLKPTKASVTQKLNELSVARLELVRLQQEIAIKEHSFVAEEHKLKMQLLQNDENRKSELHSLMIHAKQKM